MTAAKLILKLYKRIIKILHDIANRRLQVLKLSFGIWIFKFAGIISSLLFEPDEYRVFYNYFDQYSRNEKFIKEDMIVFREEAKALLFRILEAADAIVTILSNAGDVSFTDSCIFDVVVIDKAGKYIESDIWNVLDYYAAEAYFLAGDHKQLGSVVLVE
jgi:hypothetical protein